MKFKKTDLWLEITNRCRLACTKCCRTPISHLIKPIDISVENFTKIVKSGFYKSLFFCGTFGDCIYHPEFKLLIKIAKQNNVSVTIHTNGSGKSLEWWEDLFKILDSNDSLYFAMDGFEDTAGTYRVNFKTKDYQNVLQVMSTASNKYNLDVMWIFIPMKFNQDQIRQAASVAVQNNIKFCLRKSIRWWDKNDPLLPTNIKLIAEKSKILR